MVDKLEKVDCTGCAACYNSCGCNAITMEGDLEGFLYPVINYDKCTDCGICDKICPSLQLVKDNDNSPKPRVYAAWSLNPDIRIQSTSGGIFSELALNVLSEGGFVCGAKYNDEKLVEHTIIDRASDLETIRQSKYLQSSKGQVFREIKKLLLQDKKVLFCGCPCECAGLTGFLGKKYEHLILCDFVCRGANSPEVYRKFLKSLEKKYKSKVKKVWFKNKTYGWNRFSTKIDFENGDSYLKDRSSDLYIKGYISYNLYMRVCCTSCKYKELPRITDITLADFWGIDLDKSYGETDFGTSMVMINSKKGKDLFDGISCRIVKAERSLKEAVKGNPCILESVKDNPDRDEFWKQMETMDIMDNIRRFRHEGLSERLMERKV